MISCSECGQEASPLIQSVASLLGLGSRAFTCPDCVDSILNETTEKVIDELVSQGLAERAVVDGEQGIIITEEQLAKIRLMGMADRRKN